MRASPLNQAVTFSLTRICKGRRRRDGLAALVTSSRLGRPLFGERGDDDEHNQADDEDEHGDCRAIARVREHRRSRHRALPGTNRFNAVEPLAIRIA